MKRYVRPMMDAQMFVANEYVAACGDTNEEYKFACNAGEGILYYYKNGDGKIDGIYTGSTSATRLGLFESCPTKHTTKTTDDFYDGFLDKNYNGNFDNGEGVIVLLETTTYPVIGTQITNYHATAELDMNSWETAKS